MAEVLFTIPLRDSDGKLVNVNFTSDDIGVNEQSSPMSLGGIGFEPPIANFSMDDIYDVYINGEKVCYLWTVAGSYNRYGAFSTSPVPTQDPSTQYLYQGEIAYQFLSDITEENPYVYLKVYQSDGTTQDPLITGSTREEVIQNTLAFFRANKLSFKLIGEDETPSCLDGEGLYIVPTRTVKPKEYWGLSTSTKPTTAENLSIYHEVDTGDDYYFSDGTWTKVGESPEEPLFYVPAYTQESPSVEVQIPVYASNATLDDSTSIHFDINGTFYTSSAAFGNVSMSSTISDYISKCTDAGIRQDAYRFVNENDQSIGMWNIHSEWTTKFYLYSQNDFSDITEAIEWVKSLNITVEECGK